MGSWGLGWGEKSLKTTYNLSRGTRWEPGILGGDNQYKPEINLS